MTYTTLKNSAIRTTVFCTITFEAIHRWDTCNIPEVEYLKHPHRHVFWIKAYKEVTHDDRDVEFIKLKADITDYLDSRYPKSPTKGYRDLESTSCEMLARELQAAFGLCQIEVSEDNENGSLLTVVGEF